MRTLEEGHKYSLESMDKENTAGPTEQYVQFIKKEEVDGVFKTVVNGTTNEEVLLMLIDRMNSLQSKFPCRENAIVITKLEESLMWLNKRTTDRLARGVEGKNEK